MSTKSSRNTSQIAPGFERVMSTHSNRRRNLMCSSINPSALKNYLLSPFMLHIHKHASTTYKTDFIESQLKFH
jgi:hypothetical protein